MTRSFKRKEWVISDTHFGHENILDFEGEARPFSSLGEHDRALIDNWNSVVGPEDRVYHLGDAFFKIKNFNKLKELNGKKILIMGNHDVYNVDYKEVFEKVYGCLTIHKKIGKIILSHIPVHPSQLDERFVFNIHGHVHSQTIPDERYINVSVENLVGLKPADLNQVIRSRYNDIQEGGTRR